MTAGQNVKARVSHTFAASAERVFDAWLDPSRAEQWLFATPTGEMVRVEIDGRVDGKFIITERRDGEDVEHVGKYVALDRPRRVVFMLQVPKYSQQSDRVAVDIRPLATGCEVTITHEMAQAPDDAAKNAERGWTDVMKSLARVLCGAS